MEALGQALAILARDEPQAPEPDLVPDEDGVSRVSSNGGVPETLAAEGEQQVEKGGESDSGGNAKEDMDQSQGSLKRKIASSEPLSPLKNIEEFPSDEEPSQADPDIDLDGSVESFMSSGQVENLQTSVGHRRSSRKKKPETEMMGVKTGDIQKPKRMARGRGKSMVWWLC